MTRFISDILQAREPYFSQRLAELEKLAGRPGVDVRLVSDLVQRQKNIIKNLGLDTSDTRARELYYALIEKALADSNQLAEKIGIAKTDSPEIAVKKSIEHLKKALGNTRVWTLRSSVAKKQLKENPPKKLMKIFALRSVDSALKREPLSLLYTFAKKTEPIKWYEKYTHQASKLNPTDFDFQIPEISLVSELRQTQLARAGFNLNQIVYTNFDVAGIAIITPKKRFDGDVLFFVHSILENIKMLRSCSLFFKIHSLEPGFGLIIESVRKKGFSEVSRSYKNFGWDAYVKYLDSAGKQDEGLEFVFDDEVETSGVSDFLDNDKLWKNNFLVFNGENFLASCNLSDVILNAVNNRSPERAHYRFGQISLHDELFGRYMKHAEVRQLIEDQANQNG